MPNSCGYAVLASGTTMLFGTYLYPQQYIPHQLPEYKSSTYPLLGTQFIQQLIHRFSRHLTAVVKQLFPTIHTTNKNNKKFYLTNLLLIYRKAV